MTGTLSVAGSVSPLMIAPTSLPHQRLRAELDYADPAEVDHTICTATAPDAVLTVRT